MHWASTSCSFFRLRLRLRLTRNSAIIACANIDWASTSCNLIRLRFKLRLRLRLRQIDSHDTGQTCRWTNLQQSNVCRCDLWTITWTDGHGEEHTADKYMSYWHTDGQTYLSRGSPSPQKMSVSVSSMVKITCHIDIQTDRRTYREVRRHRRKWACPSPRWSFRVSGVCVCVWERERVCMCVSLVLARVLQVTCTYTVRGTYQDNTLHIKTILYIYIAPCMIYKCARSIVTRQACLVCFITLESKRRHCRWHIHTSRSFSHDDICKVPLLIFSWSSSLHEQVVCMYVCMHVCMHAVVARDLLLELVPTCIDCMYVCM